MSWHRVSISLATKIETISAEAFVNAVSRAIQATGSAQCLNEAVVYRDDSTAPDHPVFYVSPKASTIAKDVLAEFFAVACAEPNLSGLRKVLPS
jgi:hypothetical protein